MPLANGYNPDSSCPCGSSSPLKDCCLPYIQGDKPAPTAETLMRSRYSAHVLQAIDYLWNTWSPKVRKRSNKADIEAWAKACEWCGLTIVATEQGHEKDTQGTVQFIAYYHLDGRDAEHHETSLFHKFAQGWMYVDHK